MSSSTPGGSRAQTRREKAAAARAAQAARERRRRSLIGGTTAAVVLAAVVGTGIAVQASRNSTDGPSTAPAGTTSDGGFVVGQASAPVEVAVYEDFQCPACAAFEQQVGPTLTELVSAGQVRVAYHPVAFLDRASTDRYSTRALNATACAVDSAPQAFPALHRTLFEVQPAEGGRGLSDDRLVALAVDAGAAEDQVRPCVEGLAFEGWTRQVTDTASRQGVDQTPTVLVGGQRLTTWSPEALRAAVEAAARG